MATSSFDKPIVLRNKKAVDKFVQGLQRTSELSAPKPPMVRIASSEGLAEKLRRR